MNNMQSRITKWEDCPREDLKMIPKMQNAGWEVQFSYNDKRQKRTTICIVPHDPVSFQKNDKTTWCCFGRKNVIWKVTDLINGYYSNQREYDTLEEVLANE